MEPRPGFGELSPKNTLGKAVKRRTRRNADALDKMAQVWYPNGWLLFFGGCSLSVGSDGMACLVLFREHPI